MKKRVLMAGETFSIRQTVSVGYDTFESSTYTSGAEHFLIAVRDAGYDVEHLPSERCEREFPRNGETLAQYGAVVLSDIGAMSLLFSPETRAAIPSVNRLVLLHDYVYEGGGLLMAGGYNSFQGMTGGARYHGTPLEDCLPVECTPHPDGLEVPEGVVANIVTDHPIVRGIARPWPPVLGLNKVALRNVQDCTLVATVAYRQREFPLLATRTYGAGRSVAWMTDIGPHWMSRSFIEAPAYARLMQNMIAWICQDI